MIQENFFQGWPFCLMLTFSNAGWRLPMLPLNHRIMSVLSLLALAEGPQKYFYIVHIIYIF